MQNFQFTETPIIETEEAEDMGFGDLNVDNEKQNKSAIFPESTEENKIQIDDATPVPKNIELDNLSEKDEFKIETNTPMPGNFPELDVDPQIETKPPQPFDNLFPDAPVVKQSNRRPS